MQKLTRSGFPQAKEIRPIKPVSIWIEAKACCRSPSNGISVYPLTSLFPRPSIERSKPMIWKTWKSPPAVAVISAFPTQMPTAKQLTAKQLTTCILAGFVGLTAIACTSPPSAQVLAQVQSSSPNSSPPAKATSSVIPAQTSPAVAPAPKEMAANGSESLPLQEQMPYKEARQRLIQQGWQPNLQGEPPNLRDQTVKALFDLGYTEIKDCSGTGEGPCLFEFVNPQGDRLSVTATTGRSQTGERLVRRWWIEKGVYPTQSSSSSNKILEGRYWVGNTDQVLEIRKSQYRYEDEMGTQPWRPISELQAIKNGVVFDGNTYWCLSTLAPKNVAIACSAKGWVTQETQDKLP